MMEEFWQQARDDNSRSEATAEYYAVMRKCLDGKAEPEEVALADSLAAQFSDWRADSEKKNKTFAYYSLFLRLYEVRLNLYDTVRVADTEGAAAVIAATEECRVVFVAFNHLTYRRLVPMHLEALREGIKKHPDLAQALQHGVGVSFNKTGQHGVAVPVDQGLEWTNDPAKVSAPPTKTVPGAIAAHMASLDGNLLVRSLMTRVIEDAAGRPAKTQIKKSADKVWAQRYEKFEGWLRNHNPFTLATPSLTNIVTGVTVSDAEAMAILAVIDNARPVVLEDDKIIADRGVVTLFNPLKKLKVMTFATAGRGPMSRGRAVVPSQQVAATFLIAARGVCEVGVMAAFPLCRVGGSLIRDDGNMRKGQKIQMYNAIVRLAAHDDVNLTQMAACPDGSALLVDGGRLWRVAAATKPDTFGDMVRAAINIICRLVAITAATALYCVLDTYPAGLTTKTVGADPVRGQPFSLLSDSTPTPRSMPDFFTRGQNKTALNDLFIRMLPGRPPHNSLQTWNILHGGKAYSLKWPDAQYEVVPELRHEFFEADQGLVYVGLHLRRQGAGVRLTVWSEDTDVRLAVLLCLSKKIGRAHV